MDGKGRHLDNIFNERRWRGLKYEEVYLKAHASVAEARISIGAWLSFYNDERVHQAEQQQQESSSCQTGKMMDSEPLPLAA